jgi:FdhD protein
MIEDLRRDLSVLPSGPAVDAALLPGLVERLRSSQGVFDRTGGLHGAGLFEAGGQPICMREDVGRHNAVDKGVGCSSTAGCGARFNPVVSGRAGYESSRSRSPWIPMVAAVGLHRARGGALSISTRPLVGFLAAALPRIRRRASDEDLTNRP